MLHNYDKKYLQIAIELAGRALEDGGGPFGAVITKNAQVLTVARNRTKEEGNPISHAEIVAIRDACHHYGAESVVGSTIFCSCEPCSMCFSALYYAQISRVVFAATLTDVIGFGSGDPPLTSTWLKEQGHLNIQIVAGEERDREAVIALFERYIQKFGKL